MAHSDTPGIFGCVHHWSYSCAFCSARYYAKMKYEFEERKGYNDK